MDPNEQRHRKASSRSVMPLAVIAGSFFLPTLRTCTTIQSPMEAASDGVVWVVPWYLAALVLAVITGIAAVKLRTPSRREWIVGAVSVIACGLVTLTGLVMFAYRVASESVDAPFLVALAILATSTALGVASLLGARARSGWPAWTRLLLGYWSFLLPLLGLLFLHLFDGGRTEDLGIGAYFVLLAATTLGAVLGPAAIADRMR